MHLQKALRCAADIKAHPALRQIVGINSHGFCVRLIFLADLIIDRDEEFNAFLLCLLHHFACKLNLIFLADGGADRMAERFEEGVGHAAADDEGVHLVDQVGDHADFIRNLRTAENGDEGTLRVASAVPITEISFWIK